MCTWPSVTSITAVLSQTFANTSYEVSIIDRKIDRIRIEFDDQPAFRLSPQSYH